MKVSQAFPSNFLKADDLQGKPVIVTIASAELEEIGQGREKEEKLVISFKGKDKKMICNKTNANTIAKLCGDDTDMWVGQRITIMPREVEFQGEMVLAIRVSLQKPTATNSPAPAAAKPASVQQAPEPEAAAQDMEEPPF